MPARTHVVFAVALTCLLGCVHQRTLDRAKVSAPLPQWPGIWEAEPYADRTVAGRPPGGAAGIAELRAKAKLAGHPPYNPQWEALYQATLGNEALRHAVSLTRTCSFGFPRVMESPAVFQAVITPGETLFVFETQDVRHIYTDGRDHPAKEDLWPTRMGSSIGHWEGDTLVIQTIGRLATSSLSLAAWAAKLSPEARFTERIRQVRPDRIENRMTIEDPIAFDRPWDFTLSYRRVTGQDRMYQYDCDENERNPVVGGKLTITPRSTGQSGTAAGSAP